jgi:EAL domain-containing protein (putative c-di-GMP-specific phosphodiesterase class I)
MLEHFGETPHGLPILHDMGELDFIKLDVKMGSGESVRQQTGEWIAQIRQEAKSRPSLIASGIEDARILSQFWEWGLRYFQGYFLQEPNAEMRYDPL